jgi:ABC-2 type transport system permease protein
MLAGMHDVPLEQVGKLTALGARGLIPAVALAAAGFCVGLLARHTAAAIGVLLGYLFLWFVRNALLAERPWAQRLTPWTPEGNLTAVVGNGSNYEVVVDERTYQTVEGHISLAHGIGYWVAVVGVLAAFTGLIFRRRDVT